MKTKHIFIFIFSLICFSGIAQKSEKNENVKKWNYEPNFMIGIDVLNLGASFFSDRKLYQGFISSKLKDNWHGVAEAGFEINKYQKNGYNATVNGPFAKIGTFYMMSKDPENEFNGFYLGGKMAGSFYSQEYKAVPVRGFGGSNSSIAFPQTNQSSFWLEGVAGGRIQFFQTQFFIDVNVQPKYLVYSSKQDEIKPMIVPGFGKSSTKFNLGFSWNVAYRF